MMNILFVIDALWVGGTERSLADMLPYLERAGVTCAVVCLRARDEGVEAEVIARGTPVHFLGTSSLLSQVRALRQIIRKVRPNVVHSALFRADLVARLAMIGMPSALVNSIVNTTYDEARLKDPTLSRHRIRLVQAVDVVTGRLAVDRFHAVSEAARAAAIRYQRIPPGRIGVARRGRDAVRLGEPSTDRRRAARSALGLKEAAFVLISVGRQDPQKGHVELIEALAALRARRPDTELIIVGRSGTATPAIEGAIARYGVAEHVHRPGHREDVGDLLAAADVFVFPSLWEGYPGAILEAMALALPTVATDIAPVREIVTPRIGFLVRPRDPLALATAVEVLASDSGLRKRLGAAARQEFMERHTMEVGVCSMIDFYAALRGGGRGPGPASWDANEVRSFGEEGQPTARRAAVALSVIVPVYSAEDTIEEQLEALRRQEWDEPWEVVIVDNDSTDRTREIALRYAAECPRFRVVSAPVVHNLSYVRNVGVRQARGRAVAFCDGDDVIGVGWVAAMGKALGEHALVGCRMEYQRLNNPTLLASRPSTFQSEGLERVFGLPVVLGACGCQRWLWERIGGNDTSLDCGEDFDFSLKAVRDLGVTPHFAAEATYHVRLRGTAVGQFRQWRRIGRVYPLLFRRYGLGRTEPRPVTSVLQSYAWLCRNVSLLASEQGRLRWLHQAGKDLGRLEGSVKHRTAYL